MQCGMECGRVLHKCSVGWSGEATNFDQQLADADFEVEGAGRVVRNVGHNKLNGGLQHGAGFDFALLNNSQRRALYLFETSHFSLRQVRFTSNNIDVPARQRTCRRRRGRISAPARMQPPHPPRRTGQSCRAPKETIKGETRL